MLSIIIPAFRAETFIGKAVTSVLAQTLPPDEMIIGSDDGQDYKQLLHMQGITDRRIRCVSTGGTGTGPSRARNAALAAAQGEIIATVDADDWLHPATLALLVPLARSEGAAYGATTIVDFDSGAPIFNCNRNMPEGKRSLEEVLTSSMHTCSGIVFDRSRLADVHWQEGVPFWEDVLFYASCCDRLGYLYHLPKPLYVYSRREGSACNTPETGEVAQHWAKEILQRLEANRMPFENAETIAVLKAYFANRIRIEAKFIAAMNSGACRDYQQFLRDNLDLFYKLPPYSPR